MNYIYRTILSSILSEKEIKEIADIDNACKRDSDVYKLLCSKGCFLFADWAEEANYYDGQFTVNADYKKCPSYGAQLQLKCKVSNNCYVWYVINPRRWETLPDEGNIVLTLDYVVWGSYAYITKVQEVDPNLATIDASVNDSISENISNSSNGEVVTEDPVETEEFTEDDAIINNDIVIEEEVAEE